MIDELEQIKNLIEEVIGKLKYIKDEYGNEEEWPKEGDDYWVISSYGLVNKHTWNDDCFDSIALGNNAIFRTVGEAQFEAERLKVLRELEKMGRPFDFAFLNLCICLYANDKVGCRIERDVVSMYGNYYFRSEEEVKEAIEKIGEDRIKKYLFRVED